MKVIYNIFHDYYGLFDICSELSSLGLIFYLVYLKIQLSFFFDRFVLSGVGPTTSWTPYQNLNNTHGTEGARWKMPPGGCSSGRRLLPPGMTSLKTKRRQLLFICRSSRGYSSESTSWMMWVEKIVWSKDKNMIIIHREPLKMQPCS